MSIERSRNDSSLEETVSQVRHRVSLVNTPSNKRWTSVLLKKVGIEEGAATEESVPTDADTVM